MSLSILTPDELEALSHWSMGVLREAELPRDGSINRTVLLETSTGFYALRTCRKTKQAKDLQKECAVIQHVAQQDLPALIPILLSDGLPYLNLKEQLYILFPKAIGQQVVRASLNNKQLWAMGKCLARLTLALADYPTDDISRRTFQFDVNKTLEKLEHLEKHIKQFPNPGEDERLALGRIRQHQALLRTQEPSVSFEHLHFQVSHGDFHDGNLFFENNKISAIIDWDQLRVVPRYFELLRTTGFLLQELEPKLVCSFARGFLENYSVDKDDLEQTIKLHTVERIHNLWLLEAIYFEGNDKARVFLRGTFAKRFEPFEEEWRRLEVNI